MALPLESQLNDKLIKTKLRIRSLGDSKIPLDEENRKKKKKKKKKEKSQVEIAKVKLRPNQNNVMIKLPKSVFKRIPCGMGKNGKQKYCFKPTGEFKFASIKVPAEIVADENGYVPATNIAKLRKILKYMEEKENKEE